jgi:dihydrodipicolinate synthase/N-acetylneuraminate lyase
MKIGEIVLRVVRLPLVRPYRLSYRTFTEFEPIIVEARSSDGRIGGVKDTSPRLQQRDARRGLSFCREHAAKIVGKDTGEAKRPLTAAMGSSKVAATALVTAIEMLEEHRALKTDKETRLPLLAPVNATDESEIAEGIERLLAQGSAPSR